MKAGYAALFGMVVAYSVYQGTGSPGSTQSQSGSPLNSTAGLELTHSTKLRGESFPTISGGICQLQITSKPGAPCGGCAAICPAKDLTGLIEDYFRGESENETYLSAHWNVPSSQRDKIAFVIASLPDPVHTHMALLFDRAIESIQKAAQASGYLFSRAWMPWDIATYPESTDFTVRLAQTEFRERVEALPGLMIFQRARGVTGSQAPILFVFVVGETPTGGIHIEQFQNALNIRTAMLGDSSGFHDESNVLRIHGPSFSGSLSSLDKLLNVQLHDRFKTVLIRSGTISSYWAVHAFCESSVREWPDPKPGANTDGAGGNSGRPDFATFQFTDGYQEYYLSQFLEEREYRHSHVAILSEDETAFGNQEKVETDSIEPVSDPCEPEPPAPKLSFIRLYFPREIAQLREAYQRSVKAQAATEGGKNPSDNQLPLSLDVTGNDDDSVGTYAPLQTPLSQESILQSIVASLRRAHARLVVVRATDPLDTVFLCRYLRQNYPQGRLVTVGADLLMIHDLYDPRFHGILATSPYPLFNGAEFPALEDRNSEDTKVVHRLFPDSYSVGSFNAFLSLIAPNAVNKPRRINKATELPAAGYEQFGLPSFLDTNQHLSARPWRPHLWLATIGRDGYWPVKILDERSSCARDKGEEESQPMIPRVHGTPKGPAPFTVHFTVGWTVFWALTLAFTTILIIFLWFPPKSTRSEIVGRFGGQPFPVRNRLLFVATVLVAASQSVFVFPAVVWLGRMGFLEAFHGLGLVMLLYVLSLSALARASYKGFLKREEPRLAQMGAWLCGISVGLSLTFAWWFGSSPIGSRLGSFTYRYLDVGSGVSPCLPLLFLLAAWMWWCWQSLTGVVSTQQKNVIVPAASDFDGPDRVEAFDRVRLKGVSWNTGQLKRLGVLPLDLRVAIPAVAGLLAIILLMHPSEIAEAFEGWLFKWTYWVLLYSCLFLVCYLVTHIVGLWLEFRALLRSIDGLPLRRGFSDLKDLTWKPLWKLAGNGLEEFVQLLQQEIDALNQTVNSQLPSGPLSTAIQDAKIAANGVSTKYENMIANNTDAALKEVHEGFSTLQTQLAKVAAEALIYANDQWNREAFVPPKDSGKESDSNGAPIEPPAKNETTRAVEHFLCLFYLNVILIPLRRLQTLILALAGVFVFVLISYSSYPFESRESFHVLLISIFFAISLVVGIVYGQMYANPLLSRITNTKPGELGVDFWVRLGTFAFIPLLSLLSVQFPSINNFLFSWLQPALQSIK